MDYDRAKSALSGTRFPDLRHVSETGSTNADVRALLSAAVGDGDGPGDGRIVLVADYQNAGRGRLDRSWEAPPGASILMTIGLPMGPMPLERSSLLMMALSLAALDAISEVGVDGVRLKWPNDVVVPDDGRSAGHLGYRKMGGLLAELVRSPVHGPSVLLGLGLNINWGTMPDALAETAVSLDELTEHEVDRWDLIRRIVLAFDHDRLPLVESGRIDELLAGYTTSCATIGSRIRAELPDGTIFGTATGVTGTGALVVEADGRSHVLTAGDVVHLRPVADQD